MRCVVCNRSTLHPTRGYRGNCARCYNEHRKLVNTKKTTWEELEKAGKTLPIDKAKIRRFIKGHLQ